MSRMDMFSKSFYFHRFADILAGKLQQKVTAVEKIVATKKLMKEKIETFKQDKIKIPPLITKLTEQTKVLQNEVIRSE